MTDHSAVVVLDYGSQYTQLITRRVRELGVYSVILPGDARLERILSFKPRAVILSGPASVSDEGAPTLPAGFLEHQQREKLPVLGICYGMQLLARELGGTLSRSKTREYGRMEVIGQNGKRSQVWMSHGDAVEKLPPGFECVSRTASGVMASMANPAQKIVALQYHPEVTHTENGIEILKNFLFEVAGLRADWNMGSVLDEQVARVREQVGDTAHVICALSGGVDSAVAAGLVHRAVGDRLHCVFVDHGLLRFKEQERVMKMFEESLGLPVKCVDASKTFLSKLTGVTDPEKKRKIIGAEFIAVFDEAAENIAREVGKLPQFLVQGTLYPDVIESSPRAGSTKGSHKHSVTIKSHHNVGGLPENMKFQLVEPLRELFKDEVRALGRELGVPEAFLKRHPFPGPGLAVRVMGEITPESLEILRHVDEIFIESIRQAGLYDKIWQAFAVFLPIRSVGVQGDGRTHDHVVALRAVTLF